MIKLALSNGQLSFLISLLCLMENRGLEPLNQITSKHFKIYHGIFINPYIIRIISVSCK